MGKRIGGRLFSAEVEGMPEYPIEFGGMFFTNEQKNVWGLIGELAKDQKWASRLGKRWVDWKPRYHYLRGKRLVNADFSDPTKTIPYDLRSDETCLDPTELLVSKINCQFPGLKKALWPYHPKPRQETALYLRKPWKGRPLHEWGFWNFLNEISSNEAYELMLIAIGCSSGLRNSNAFDAIWSLLHDAQSQYYYQLNSGYQQLPECLLEAAEENPNVKRQTEHEVSRIEARGQSMLVHFEGRREPVEAEQVILALPRRALERVEFSGVFPKSFKDEDLAAVISVPASKLFLGYKQAWWREDIAKENVLPKADVAASYTDLPIRQIYYYGKAEAGEPGLLLASYADDAAESFWKGLRPPVDNGEARFPDLSSAAGPDAFASEAMVQTAIRQLGLMHPEFVVTNPAGANFVDWGDEPYGAAWHAWKAYRESWKDSKRMRRPNSKLPVFICGEAYATLQGWVEGAINTAELVLQEGFGLPRADWLPATYELTIEE